MTLNSFNRRDVLKTMTTLVTASSLAEAVNPSAARAAVAAPALSPALGQVDQALRDAVNAGTVPGVVAIGANDGGIVYEGAFGPSITADSVFWIASMTKAITATACHAARRTGKAANSTSRWANCSLNWNRPKSSTASTPTVNRNFVPRRATITLRHLLTHTAGFTYSTWSEPMTKYEKATGTPSIGDCKNATFTGPLEFDPGERWQYGINMDWVGKAVEAVSDQSLEIYFREKIFAPLGMSDPVPHQLFAEGPGGADVQPRDKDGKLTPTAFEMPQRPEFFMGGGALFSTPRNYMQFLQMQLHQGTFAGAQVLKPETVALMQQNHIGELNVVTLKTAHPETSNDANLFPGMEQKWGLSWAINMQPGPAGRSAGSVAWAGLFNTYFWIDPTKRVTGMIMTQLLPFADPEVLKLFAKFESGMYEAVG